MKLKKIAISTLCVLIGIGLGVVLLKSNFVFVTNCGYEGKFGIIDEGIYQTYGDNVICNGMVNHDGITTKTHGDKLMDFLKVVRYDGKIYYFSALDDNRKISGEKIIDGLNWMLDNDIKYVNISLSSMFYDEALNTWINEHPQIKIFASYNNNYNNIADYPAMYSRVIGIGNDDRIQYKDRDIDYQSNRIIVLSKGIHYFKGNSYLTLYSILRQQ